MTRVRRAAVRHWIVASLTTLGVGACLSGTELVSPPRIPVTSVTLEFRVDSEDAATAAALGWANGIPGVQVTVTPADTTHGSPRLLQGTDSGTLFLDQLAGRYGISVDRWLTDSERAHLPPGDDAVGFIARTAINTMTGSARVRVDLVASRRRGLVISEWAGNPLFTGQEGTYFGSEYLRIYNNSDTTIYLDGLIVGSGLAAGFDYPNFPCQLYLPYSLDPRGVWANRFHQLPGNGADYPLSPGETVVLATDAIDHRPLFSIGLDLRRANFEFYEGAGDVDNPAVPNTVDVGPRKDPTRHGVLWGGLDNVAFLASPFDLTTIQTEFFGNGTWARMPGSALWDVVAMRTTYVSGYPRCTWLVDPRFDRQPVQLLGARIEDDLLAYRRREIPFLIGGQKVLQNTRASAWDFVTKLRDPFTVP